MYTHPPTPLQILEAAKERLHLRVVAKSPGPSRERPGARSPPPTARWPPPSAPAAHLHLLSGRLRARPGPEAAPPAGGVGGGRPALGAARPPAPHPSPTSGLRPAGGGRGGARTCCGARAAPRGARGSALWRKERIKPTWRSRKEMGGSLINCKLTSPFLSPEQQCEQSLVSLGRERCCVTVFAFLTF